MGFLRRLLGGRGDDSAADPAVHAVVADPAAVDDEERARELQLARFDEDRVDDLIRRQQRFADRSWTPPPQGGERRADDEDAAGR